MEGPVVLQANYHQFGRRTQIAHPVVQSRALLWAKEGGGLLMVNGETLTVAGGDVLVLPWNHSVTYLPDPRAPYLTAMVHIIPIHDSSEPVQFRVPHSYGDPLFDTPSRRDAPIGGQQALARGTIAFGDPLGHLMEYAIGVFERGMQTERLARSLGELIVGELESSPHAAVVRADMPRQLLALLSHVRHFLSEPYSMQSLADHMSCSESSVNRLFAEYTGLPPMRWLRNTRLDRAASLLVSTDLPVAAVGESVGIPDQAHFARLFGRRFHATATAYRRLHCR